MKFCSRDWRQKSTASLPRAMWWTTSGLTCLSLATIGEKSLVEAKA